MKHFYLIFSILTVSLSLSCQTESDNRVNKVTLYDYQVWISNLDTVDLRDSVALYTDTFLIKGEKNVVIRDSLSSDSVYSFAYSIKQDSLFFFGSYCPLIDSVFINYEGRKVKLYKSEYDEEGIVDEESILYWNHEYGLIAVYNYPWGGLLLIEPILIRDFARKNFYEYFIAQKRKY